MALPNIKTAIPKRRYQYGEFSLVLLGDIESGDQTAYQFVLAVVPPRAHAPELAVSAVKLPRDQRAQGMYQMQVSAANAGQVVGHSDQWQDIEIFAQDALNLLRQMMNLEDEQPMELT
jgi:hypothetical protein